MYFLLYFFVVVVVDVVAVDFALENYNDVTEAPFVKT